MYIGPAGENKVRIASIMAKLTHAAGYGGYGAVMGSKNLKAIVVKGTKSLPKIADLESFKKLLQYVHRQYFERTFFLELWELARVDTLLVQNRVANQ